MSQKNMSSSSPSQLVSNHNRVSTTNMSIGPSTPANNNQPSSSSSNYIEGSKSRQLSHLTGSQTNLLDNMFKCASPDEQQATTPNTTTLFSSSKPGNPPSFDSATSPLLPQPGTVEEQKALDDLFGMLGAPQAEQSNSNFKDRKLPDSFFKPQQKRPIEPRSVLPQTPTAPKPNTFFTKNIASQVMTFQLPEGASFVVSSRRRSRSGSNTLKNKANSKTSIEASKPASPQRRPSAPHSPPSARTPPPVMHRTSTTNIARRPSAPTYGSNGMGDFNTMRRASVATTMTTNSNSSNTDDLFLNLPDLPPVDESILEPLDFFATQFDRVGPNGVLVPSPSQDSHMGARSLDTGDQLCFDDLVDPLCFSSLLDSSSNKDNLGLKRSATDAFDMVGDVTHMHYHQAPPSGSYQEQKRRSIAVDELSFNLDFPTGGSTLFFDPLELQQYVGEQTDFYGSLIPAHSTNSNNNPPYF